jgi:hypothetical protein
MKETVEFDVQQSEPWSDCPRPLTADESAALRHLIDTYTGMGTPRLPAIKLYREMTRASLKAAVSFVDGFMDREVTSHVL